MAAATSSAGTSSDVDVEDAAEEAALRQRRRVVLRLAPALLAQTRVAGSAGQLSAERLTDCIEEGGDDPQGLRAALLALAGLPSGWRARLEILERVPSEVIWSRGTTDARCALVARKRLGRQLLARLTSDESLSEAARALCRVALGAEEPAEPTTETTLGSFGAEVTLARHSRDVREKARAFAARCGLPESLVQDVALAAFLHDAGKAERRFQLNSGSARAACCFASPSAAVRYDSDPSARGETRDSRSG